MNFACTEFSEVHYPLATPKQRQGYSLVAHAPKEAINGEVVSRLRAGTEQATQSAQAGVRTLSETTAGLLGTATGAAGATVEGAGQAAEAVVFPIEDYDELNVDEVSKRLADLSVEELQLVRDYEELNKRRETLLEQMDRKIRAA